MTSVAGHGEWVSICGDSFLLAVSKYPKSNLRKEGFVGGQFHSLLWQGRQGPRNEVAGHTTSPVKTPVNK